MQTVQYRYKSLAGSGEIIIKDSISKQVYTYKIDVASVRNISYYKIRINKGYPVISLPEGKMPLAHKVFYDALGYYPEIAESELRTLKDLRVDTLVDQFLNNL